MIMNVSFWTWIFLMRTWQCTAYDSVFLVTDFNCSCITVADNLDFSHFLKSLITSLFVSNFQIVHGNRGDVDVPRANALPECLRFLKANLHCHKWVPQVMAVATCSFQSASGFWRLICLGVNKCLGIWLEQLVLMIALGKRPAIVPHVMAGATCFDECLGQTPCQSASDYGWRLTWSAMNECLGSWLGQLALMGALGKPYKIGAPLMSVMTCYHSKILPLCVTAPLTKSML